MAHIVYFKRQAKILFKDYKTRTPYVDDVSGRAYYRYSPKCFDVDSILLDYDFDENDFCLMKAQHTIALMVGFSKWADLVKASEADLALAKLIFEYKVSFDDWEMYIAGVGRDIHGSIDSDSKLEIFKKVFIDERVFELHQDYHRLN